MEAAEQGLTHPLVFVVRPVRSIRHLDRSAGFHAIHQSPQGNQCNHVDGLNDAKSNQCFLPDFGLHTDRQSSLGTDRATGNRGSFAGRS